MSLSLGGGRGGCNRFGSLQMVWCFSQFGCAAGVHIVTVVVWDIVLVCTFWPRNKGCKIGRNFCYIVVHLIRSKNILKDHSSSNSRNPLGWKRGRKRFLGRLDHLSGHISCSNLIWNRLWNFASGRLKWLREKSYLLVWKEGRVLPEGFFANPLPNFPEVSLWAKYQYKKNH